MPLVVIGLIMAATLATGFAAGFVTFRRSQSWCPSCGAGLRCTECAHRRMAC